ncbi:MAG: translation initiation factor 2 [Parvibaculum sp.]
MKSLVSLVFLSVALAGCSSIIEGTSQEIAVNSEPSGAACAFEREGRTIAKVDPTPGVVRIDKTKHDISIVCSKEGYEDATYLNRSDVAAMTAGNIILGGGVGWIIDSASGADNKYDGSVFVTMVPKK